MHDTVDGMCVDCAGNVYAGTWAAWRSIRRPAVHRHRDHRRTSNCTFGGADRKTLYVTSRSVLKYVTLDVPGLPD